jgi:hypothetical protein
MKSGVARDYAGVGSAIVVVVPTSTLIVPRSTGTSLPAAVLPVLQVALIPFKR